MGDACTYKNNMSCRSLDSPEGQPRSDIHPQHILVVDDEPDIRDALAFTLDRMGFSVLLAGDGTTAINLYKTHLQTIMCVVLDMKLPDLDGADVLKILRELTPEIKVILISGLPRYRLNQRLTNVQPDAFLTKPYELENLRRTVRDLTGGVQPAREAT